MVLKKNSLIENKRMARRRGSILVGTPKGISHQ